MAFLKARDNETQEVRLVSEEWIARWPDDYTVVVAPEVLEPIEEPKPSTGVIKKEKS